MSYPQSPFETPTKIIGTRQPFTPIKKRIKFNPIEGFEWGKKLSEERKELTRNSSRFLDFSEDTINLKRTEGFNIFSSDKNELRKRLVNKKFCKNIIKYGKCHIEGCSFAHSIDTFNPRCIFEDVCKYQGTKCTFLHPQESFEEYCKKLNIPINGELNKSYDTRRDEVPPVERSRGRTRSEGLDHRESPLEPHSLALRSPLGSGGDLGGFAPSSQRREAPLPARAKREARSDRPYKDCSSESSSRSVSPYKKNKSEYIRKSDYLDTSYNSDADISTSSPYSPEDTGLSDNSISPIHIESSDEPGSPSNTEEGNSSGKSDKSTFTSPVFVPFFENLNICDDIASLSRRDYVPPSIALPDGPFGAGIASRPDGECNTTYCVIPTDMNAAFYFVKMAINGGKRKITIEFNDIASDTTTYCLMPTDIKASIYFVKMAVNSGKKKITIEFNDR
jgi:hypothetical protein